MIYYKINYFTQTICLIQRRNIYVTEQTFQKIFKRVVKIKILYISNKNTIRNGLYVKIDNEIKEEIKVFLMFKIKSLLLLDL